MSGAAWELSAPWEKARGAVDVIGSDSFSVFLADTTWLFLQADAIGPPHRKRLETGKDTYQRWL